MANIGDVIAYYHGKDDVRFHEGVDSHKAELRHIGDGNVASLVILDREGKGIIPIKGVKHKKDKTRNKNDAYWSE